MTSPSVYVPSGVRETTCKAGEVNLFQLAPGKGAETRAGQGQGRRVEGEEAMGLSQKPGYPQSSLQESSKRGKRSSHTSGKTQGRKKSQATDSGSQERGGHRGGVGNTQRDVV